MNNDKEHLSPLVDKVAINSDNISLQQNEFIGKINLRVKENDQKAREVIENYFDYNLPKSSGEVSGNDEGRVLWLGPNEYLILCSDQNKSNIINNLNENLKTSFYALTDVSDYYLTMRLSGPKSIEVLSKACPLNFEKNLLKKNSCAQSYISKATVLIDRLSDEPIFDISVRWSFAEYLWDWLADSSSEFVISE